MSKRGRPKKKHPYLEELPASLRFAIVKVMSKFKIMEVGEAFERAALLIDINSKLFERMVTQEAESRYRSRHLSELNKARSTIAKEAFERGRNEGYREAEIKNRVWYYCKVCGKKMYLEPNSNDHDAVIEYMQKDGWGHAECHEKSK